MYKIHTLTLGGSSERQAETSDELMRILRSLDRTQLVCYEVSEYTSPKRGAPKEWRLLASGMFTTEGRAMLGILAGDL